MPADSIAHSPPKQLHLNTFPYKATKHDQPIWSDSLKFIGAVKTLMWESFLSAIHKTTTQKEYFLKKMTHTMASQVGELPSAADGAPRAYSEMQFQTAYLSHY